MEINHWLLFETLFAIQILDMSTKADQLRIKTISVTHQLKKFHTYLQNIKTKKRSDPI